MELDRTEARILGALIEKGWTTPQQYPLTLNALLAACNQKSNRDPVLALEEFEVEGCLRGLRMKGLVREHERDGGRVSRFEGLLAKELGLSRQEEAIVAELLLRGPQTPPELYRRCARMASYADASEVTGALREMAGRGLTRLLPREPGRRHARWTELLTPHPPATTEPVPEPAAHVPAPAAPPPTTPAPPAPTTPDLAGEVAALRREVDELRLRVQELEQRL